MQNSQLKYKFYATLLDSFTRYLTSEADEAFKELIDKINRVPFESEAASKGTAFNVLVDSIVQEGYDKLGEDNTVFEGFEFNTDIINEFASHFKGAIAQYRTHGTIETKYGIVLLYGDVDEILRDKAFDIKTTSRYDFPKFIHNWQHRIYPYCLNQEGFQIDEFQYYITDFKNTFKESYIPNIKKDEKDIKIICEYLIEFLEEHRYLITDKKVFALDDKTELVND